MKILHVDMDAFYASVEQRDDPRLRGMPIAVGGSPRGRGVVAAASYEARRFGVRSAMPSAVALRKCPDLQLIRPDFEKYRAVSAQVFAVLADYSPRVEPLSIDEAFLDATHHRSGTWVAQDIRRRIHRELGLTASVGVAPVKMVAKIASGFRKPDGLTVVEPGQVRAFLDPLAVDRLWGVGPVTARRLQGLGIRTIGQLAELHEARLTELFGRNGAQMARLARGDDPRPVQPHRARRSRSAERTFARDLQDPGALLTVIRDQAAEVCEGLRRKGHRGRTVTLKVRYDDFTTITRSRSLLEPTANPDLVIRIAEALLAETEAGQRPVRLVGVGVSNLEAGRQLCLELGCAA
ncbi:MAG: DNA polymerase IV [Alphaproteobacteria bacterium]|nr:DNA polymerase IV [Alphaproteobacteria bacterium]